MNLKEDLISILEFIAQRLVYFTAYYEWCVEQLFEFYFLIKNTENRKWILLIDYISYF